MQEDNKENLKRTRINGWNHACSRLHDWFRNIYVSSDMVRQLGSAGWLIAMWVLTGTITVIAAVSYGELSAMFPKAGGQYIYILRRHMENSLVFYTVGVSLP
jgi:APA family basic amino acid/polyamine antiporter